MLPKSLIALLLIAVILIAGCATSDRTATVDDTSQTDSLDKDKQMAAAIAIFIFMIQSKH